MTEGNHNFTSFDKASCAVVASCALSRLVTLCQLQLVPQDGAFKIVPRCKFAVSQSSLKINVVISTQYSRLQVKRLVGRTVINLIK